ncbi:MAG TPA: hypothetical protein VJ623_10040 [Holophagaceae bacterium]|nr:hypothetical protein [Holophagaceae bacterium]
MRAFLAPLALAASLTLPLAAQAQSARFIKVDIVSKDGMRHHHGAKDAAKKSDGPTTVKMRLPVALATSALQCAQDSEIKVNGENKKGIKTDELVKMLQSAKPGDLLLEIDTNDGDHVRITIE